METTPLGSASALTPVPPAPLAAPDAVAGGAPGPTPHPDAPELGLTDDLPAAPPWEPRVNWWLLAGESD